MPIHDPNEPVPPPLQDNPADWILRAPYWRLVRATFYVAAATCPLIAVLSLWLGLRELFK